MITVSTAELNQYPLGPVVNGALPYPGRREPDGRLIRQHGGAEISIVTDYGMRRPFSNLKAFLALGFTFCNVATVRTTRLTQWGKPSRSSTCVELHASACI